MSRWFLKSKIGSAFLLIFLAGCGSVPLKLGIAPEVWLAYPPEKRVQLLANYKQFLAEHQSHRSKVRRPPATTKLLVKISGGQVKMPPFDGWQSYQPVQFAIFAGQCLDLKVSHETQRGSSVGLEVCYRNNKLSLDPSHYDPEYRGGTLHIYYSPLWRAGFAYQKLHSSGYVNFKEITIEILESAE